VPKICIELEGKEEREKNVVMNTKPNTNHAELATQVERQVEKKAYTHDTASLKQANRQGRCVRETEAVIGKAPRLGIPNPVRQTPSRVSARTLRGIFREQRWRNFSSRVCVWGGGCKRWVRGGVGQVWLGGKGECSVVG